jgi:reverse gyrase
LRIFICHAKFGETNLEMVSTKRTWSTQDVRDLVQDKFRKRPCYFQIKVAQTLYAGKDVVACAPTGAGKTLTFWIPILMALEEGEDKMSIVVTPLECRTSSINPTVACCKLDIATLFFALSYVHQLFFCDLT